MLPVGGNAVVDVFYRSIPHQNCRIAIEVLAVYIRLIAERALFDAERVRFAANWR